MLGFRQPERLGLYCRGALEFHRRHGHSRNAVDLEPNRIVQTARCAGSSVGERLDHEATVLRDPAAQVVGRGPREGVLSVAPELDSG